MKTIDLKKINDRVEQFVNERDWDQFHSIKNLTAALSVESSELVEIFQWLTEAESNQAKLNPALKTKVEDEVADVFVYLLRVVSKMDIDLEEVVLRKIQKNAQKYPIEKARGKATKYSDF